LLHLGHAQTFWLASQRAAARSGILVYRDDDLDGARCQPEFAAAAMNDLRWLGLTWAEGPDVGGPHAPYQQTQRKSLYREALRQLHAAGCIFPCTRSRRDVLEAAGAPHENRDGHDEPVYPISFRPAIGEPLPPLTTQVPVNWRFRVPEDKIIAFHDHGLGPQRATAGRDFGDFVVWRKDDIPSYQLACVVDDALMGITEVVRGADLVTSTFRQLLLYRALTLRPPEFTHCPLVTDNEGLRLAKRHDALSLRTLRESGITAASLVADFSRTLPFLSK
jgi:glutamyl-tRNA synthetase